jgi:dienelactone hydrolase
LQTDYLGNARKVSFYSDHSKLAGLLWIPKKKVESGQKKLPAVVLARGFGSLKEFVNPGFASRLNSEDYIALAFDYRGLGESEGMPGNLLPLDHAEDIRSAVTFLESIPEVDLEKIGLIGDSMGASHVIWAAAHDKRAKCVISYGGPGNMDRWFRSLIGYERYLEWQKIIKENRLQRVLSGKSLCTFNGVLGFQ